MADNLTTTTTVSTVPSGTVIATDDAGAGGHVQLVKLAISTDGSATALTADNTDGLLVNLGTNNDVTVTGTVTVDSELPAAAAMADAAANPTVPAVGARVSVFNGTTWDRMRGNTTGTYVHGGTAHDAADAGNPVKVGGKAYNFDGTVPGTAVAENDRANFITDVYGRQFVETSHPRYFNARADYASAQTNATVQAAPGAGLKLYITDIVISNGATAGNITLLDGSGGTVIFEIYPAINGGASTNLRTPIALTANTLLAITSTTVTTHSVMVNGYIAP